MENGFIKQYVNRDYSKYVSEIIQVETDKEYSNLISDTSIKCSERIIKLNQKVQLILKIIS